MVDNKELAQQYNVFRNNIRYFRKKNHLTQEQFAERCDLSTSYIKQIESGKEFKNISLTVILKLSKALNVSVNKLFVNQKIS